MKNIMKNWVCLIMFLCLIYTASATDYSVDFNIVEGKVLVSSEINYDYQKYVELNLDIPKDAKAVSLYLDDKPTTPIIQDDKLIIKDNVKKISFNFLTKEILGDDEFLVSLSLLEADKLSISLVLSEGYVLQKPVEEKTLTSDAVYPKPTSITSDGQRIKLIWERSNIKQGDDFSIFVKFKKETNYALIVSGVLFVIVVLFFVAKILMTKEKPVKREEKKETKQETKQGEEKEILKHLKEDEEIVVNVLKQRDGQCEQGTLRVVTGFPKATLSRILKELDDRKIIYKEKRGKKNLVFLK